MTTMNLFHIEKIIKIDLINYIQYGRPFPRYAERLYINPKEVIGINLKAKKRLGWDRRCSGKVIKNWPLSKRDYKELENLEKVKHCLRHWKYEIPWEETGAYQFYIDKFPRKEVVERHRRLDQIYLSSKRINRLRAQCEINISNFREEDGVRINIGPEGELVFCDGGTHRLAMSIILDFERIPAQLGCIHVNALDKLPKLRSPN